MYIELCSEQIDDSPQRFWNLASAKTKGKSFPQEMVLEGETADNPQSKAQLFNKFFSSVFTEPVDGLILPEIEVQEIEELALITLTEDEVCKVLKGLDIHKAEGPDNLPTKILKECAQTLTPSITTLFNKSLSEGIFPEAWKTAIVCPIHKKGNKCDVSNYRPVSLLSVLSKALERCVYNKIADYIKPQLHRLQHGFIAGKSTATQLLQVYEDIGRKIDNRGQVDTVFLDLAKAFDSVSHQLLVHKLKRYGFKGELLKWLESYLSNRQQFTVGRGSKIR